MKAIQNVIEMLSSIIKDGQSMTDLEAALVESETTKSSPPPKSLSDSYKRKSQTPESTKDTPEKYHYVHYDTGLHWCRLCDNFPETAKDFLVHLQDKKHRETAKQNDVDNTPWHKLPAEPVLPSYEEAPTKRIPIKGILGISNICLYLPDSEDISLIMFMKMRLLYNFRVLINTST